MVIARCDETLQNIHTAKSIVIWEIHSNLVSTLCQNEIIVNSTAGYLRLNRITINNSHECGSRIISWKRKVLLPLSAVIMGDNTDGIEWKTTKPSLIKRNASTSCLQAMEKQQATEAAGPKLTDRRNRKLSLASLTSNQNDIKPIPERKTSFSFFQELQKMDR